VFLFLFLMDKDGLRCWPTPRGEDNLDGICRDGVLVVVRCVVELNLLLLLLILLPPLLDEETSLDVDNDDEEVDDPCCCCCCCDGSGLTESFDGQVTTAILSVVVVLLTLGILGGRPRFRFTGSGEVSMLLLLLLSYCGTSMTALV
jgi:hypothetical protein